MGNMILIKDRHYIPFFLIFICKDGKYDTYKGSTLTSMLPSKFKVSSGKYDTYKESTQGLCIVVHHSTGKGNMILIKDRHLLLMLEKIPYEPREI